MANPWINFHEQRLLDTHEAVLGDLPPHTTVSPLRQLAPGFSHQDLVCDSMNTQLDFREILFGSYADSEIARSQECGCTEDDDGDFWLFCEYDPTCYSEGFCLDHSRGFWFGDDGRLETELIGMTCVTNCGNFPDHSLFVSWDADEDKTCAIMDRETSAICHNCWFSGQTLYYNCAFLGAYDWTWHADIAVHPFLDEEYDYYLEEGYDGEADYYYEEEEEENDDDENIKEDDVEESVDPGEDYKEETVDLGDQNGGQVKRDNTVLNDSDSGGNNTPLVIGVVVAAVVILIGATVGIVVFCAQKNKNRAAIGGQAVAPTAKQPNQLGDPQVSGMDEYPMTKAPEGPPEQYPSHPSPRNESYNRATKKRGEQSYLVDL